MTSCSIIAPVASRAPWWRSEPIPRRHVSRSHRSRAFLRELGLRRVGIPRRHQRTVDLDGQQKGGARSDVAAVEVAADPPGRDGAVVPGIGRSGPDRADERPRREHRHLTEGDADPLHHRDHHMRIGEVVDKRSEPRTERRPPHRFDRDPEDRDDRNVARRDLRDRRTIAVPPGVAVPVTQRAHVVSPPSRAGRPTCCRRRAGRMPRYARRR